MQRRDFSGWTVGLLVFSATATLAAVIFLVLPLPESLWPGTVGSLLAKAGIVILVPIVVIRLLAVLATRVQVRRNAEADDMAGILKSVTAVGGTDDTPAGIIDQLWVVTQTHGDDDKIVVACARRLSDMMCGARGPGEVVDCCLSVIRESQLNDNRRIVERFADAAANVAVNAMSPFVRDSMLSLIQTSRTAERGIVQRAYEACYSSLPFEAKARAVSLSTTRPSTVEEHALPT